MGRACGASAVTGPRAERAVVALAVMVSMRAAAVGAELKLDLYPTIHCIGVRITDVPDEITAAKLEYRKQGRPDWRPALPMVLCYGNRFADSEGPADETADETQAAWEDAPPMIHRLHGSIFYLEPGTTYEVRATLLDAKGQAGDSLLGTVATRPDGVASGKGRILRVGADAEHKTIQAALLKAEPGDTVVVSPGVYKESLTKWPEAEPGKPITLRGEKGAILDGEGIPKTGDVCAGINLEERHDIIIEGLQIQRFDYCVFVKRSQNIVLQRNLIDLTRSKPHANYGIRFKSCRDCLIQYNTVREPEKGQGDYTKYPLSFHHNRGIVVRYNRVSGCCQDINDNRNNSDTDIYENHYRGTTADDGVELESGVCVNLRFWGNTLDNHDGGKVAISVTPVTVGPVYVFRNLVLAPFECIKFCNGGTTNALAAGHRMANFAPLFFYHNTFYMNPANKGQISLFRCVGLHGNLTLVNNIFYGTALPDVTKNLRADRSSADFFQLWADYNIEWDEQTKKSLNAGMDEHSLFVPPQLMDVATCDLRPKAGSPAIDAGTVLPNINDEFTGKAPDIGCFELGAETAGRTLKEPLKEDPR